MLSALATAGALVLDARAQDPAPSTTTVEPEPPGANCANGGVRITVTTPEPTPTPTPTPEPTPTPTPEPEPTAVPAQAAEPTVTYVCNGADAVGEPGPPGNDGTDGRDGSDGNDGVDGGDGLGADDDDRGSATTAPRRRCQASRRVVSWRLPERFRGHRVRLRVNGQRRHPRLIGRAVRVDLRGLRCGVYPILAQAAGVRSALRIYHVQGAYRLTRVRVG